MFCWTWDITVWISARMTSAQLWSRRHHLPWADVIRADFQTVISRYLHNVNTRFFCTADRMFRTIIMQNSRLVYACFPIKIDEVWIDRFCVRYDWWRRLQPTSSVSPVCSVLGAQTRVCQVFKGPWEDPERKNFPFLASTVWFNESHSSPFTTHTEFVKARDKTWLGS